MSAPSDASLTTRVRLNFNTTYKRTDVALNTAQLKDDIAYTDINFILTHGRGADKANLQYYDRRTLVNATELFNLDGGITNKWGQTLDYDAVKVLIIRNRETDTSRYLEVVFKNEHYYIGPGGSRVIFEPAGKGVQAIVSSQSTEEGTLSISSNGSVTYDIIVIGASGESSSSSGL